MILALLSPQSLLQNCLPPAANQKLGRCRRAVLVAREVFTRPPRDESFTLNTRLGLVSITQQALCGIKSKIIGRDTLATGRAVVGWSDLCLTNSDGRPVASLRRLLASNILTLPASNFSRQDQPGSDQER